MIRQFGSSNEARKGFNLIRRRLSVQTPHSGAWDGCWQQGQRRKRLWHSGQAVASVPGHGSFSTLDAVRVMGPANHPNSVTPDHESKRDAMKDFLLSLQVVTQTAITLPFNLSGSTVSTAAWRDNAQAIDSLENIEQSVSNHQVEAFVVVDSSLSSEEIAAQDEDHSTPTIATIPDTPPKKSLRITHSVRQSRAIPRRTAPARTKTNAPTTQMPYRLRENLDHQIRSKNIKESVRAFDDLKKQSIFIKFSSIQNLYFLIAETNPIKALEVFDDYYEHPHNNGIHVGAYFKLCKGISRLDPQNMVPSQIPTFMDNVTRQFERTEVDIQSQIYPQLVSALLQQRSAFLGEYAAQFYNLIVERDFEMSPRWLAALLVHSRYHRQTDVPFHDVFQRLVETGYRPFPPIALKAVANMFPFHRPNQASIVMQCILDLNSKKYDADPQHSIAANTQNYTYKLDFGILEAMTESAARHGDVELAKLVWNAINQFEVSPTQAIFENSVIAFAKNRIGGLEMAFSALAAMEAEGHEVSRALLRSFSLTIRSKSSEIILAHDIIKHPSNRQWLSTNSLNIIIAAFAERGNAYLTTKVYEDFALNDLEPNHDTYSFVMEALGKNTRKRKSFGDDAKDVNLAAADRILQDMEAQGIEPCAELVHQYIELLCETDEIATATAIVMDSLDKSSKRLDNKSLYRVAAANATIGNIDIAKKLAESTSEIIPSLHKKIDSKEQRFLHLQKIQKRTTTTTTNSSSTTS